MQKASTQILFIFLFCIFSVLKGTAQMAGNYTINSGASASATNYTSFTAAINDLRDLTRGDGGPDQNTGSGVTGPVVFTVSAGTYNEQLLIPLLTGVSTSKYVTFQGAGKDSTFLTYSTNSSNQHVIRFSSAKYIYFRNMSIQSSGTTDGWIVHIFNSSRIGISNCRIEFTNGTAQTSSGTNLACFVLNGSTTSMGTSATSIDSIDIDSNIIRYGYYNLYAYTGSSDHQINIRGDSLTNAYYTSLYFWICNYLYRKIQNNRIYLRSGGAGSQFAIWSWASTGSSSSRWTEISGNLFTSLNGYGIAETYGGNSTQPARFFNNILGGNSRGTTRLFSSSGAACCAFNYWQIYHNTFYLDYTSGTSYGFETGSNSGGTSVVLKNNIFHNPNSGNNNIPLNIGSSSAFSSVDYNNYYNAYPSGALALIGGIPVTSSNYRAAYPSGLGLNSSNRNVSFTSSSDYHMTTSCLNGQTGLGVSLDYDGVSRSTPHMGAYQQTGSISNDVGIMKINSPGFPLSTGSQSINITLKNYGGNTVTSCSLVYVVNGGSPVTEYWSGTLTSCDTVNITLAIPYTFTIGSNNLKVYTNSPNATTDSDVSNDTAQFTLCPGMSGNYTINGGGGGNYTTFAQAVSDLLCAGLSGPVTFTVYPGTYNEKVVLNTNILGASSTNTLTIQSSSGNPSDVVLTASGTSTDNYIMSLAGLSYVKLKNFTITNTNTSYGTVLYFSAGTSYDSLYNMTLNGVSTTSTSSNLAVIYSNTNSPCNFIYFDSCRINNGSYGSYFVSNTSIPSAQNLTYNNCDFTNQYYQGIYNQYLNGIKLNKNRITTNSSYTSYYGMYNYWIMVNADINRPVITGNTITGGAGGHGIYNYYVGVNSSITYNRRALIANNMIQIGSSSNSAYGMRISSDYGSNIIYNSINMGSSLTSNSAAALYLESCNSSNDSVFNNCAATYNGAPAIRLDNNSQFPFINNNNYYTTGTNLAYITTTPYTTFGAFTTATGKDANSVNVNPTYTTNTNLHSNAGGMDTAGRVTNLTTVDIDNDVRCPNGGCAGGGNKPDIGADEFAPTALDASAQAISSPTSPCPGSSSSVIVTIKNIGSSTLTSATIGWSVNGSVQTPYSWTGSLSQGSSASGITIGSYTFTGYSNSIKVWTESPNSSTDQNLSNDTLTTTLLSKLNGVYTVGGSSPDFANFTAVATILNSSGVCGPTTFLIREGTYSEKIILNTITGASASNMVVFRPDPANTNPVILTAGSNTSSDNYTFGFNGTSFVTVRGIKIYNTSTGSYKSTILFSGSQDSITLSSNLISNSASTSSSASEAVINGLSASGNIINRITIDSNQIYNGSIGIYLEGYNSSTLKNKIRIRYNTLTDMYYYGLYLRYLKNLETTGNRIYMDTTGYGYSYGVYLDYVDSFRIFSNYINLFNGYGLYIGNACNYQNNTGSYKSLIANNMIGGYHTSTGPIGIYLTPNSSTPIRHLNIYYNSISITSTAYPIFGQQTASNQYVSVDIQNNSFANFGNGFGSYLYFSTGTPFTVNYNNYYSLGGTAQLIGTSSSNSATLLSPTYNASSKAGNPNYRNYFSDLRSQVSSTQLNNCAYNFTSVVGTDIEGQSRPLSPSSVSDIGADEYNIPVNDAGAVQVTSPSAPLSPGTQNVVVQIKNYGTATCSTANVSYRVGAAGSVKTQGWTGSMATNATSTSTFSGANQYNFTGSQIDTVYIWTASPNSTSDEYTSNDTAVSYICSPLSGIYTINPAGSGATNFTSFSSAVTILQSCGVSGPVIFNVAASTYTEQLLIGNIYGASSTNTITFDGGNGNQASRVLTYSATNSDPYVVRLNGCNYVTFRNITINSSGSTAGWSVHVMSGTGCRFNNCIIGFTGTGITSTSVNYLPVLLSGGTTISNYNTSTTTINNFTLDSSTLNYGYFGVAAFLNSASNTIYINNNNINQSYYYGVYISGNQVIKMNRNAINLRTNNSSNSGIYIINATPSGSNYHTLNGNSIYDAGNYGIYVSSSNGSSSDTGQIINNIIGGTFRNSAVYGIYSNSSRYKIYHNSVQISSTSQTSTSACLYMASGSLNFVKNNIFSVPVVATGNTYSVYTGSSSYISQLDYNNYYNVTGNLLYIGGTTYTASTYLAAYTSGGGLNSINAQPWFVSNNNLHITNPCNNGTNLNVSDDLDGNSRSSSPDLGSDELISTTDNLMIDSIIAPVSATLTSLTQDIRVRIRNIGTNTITSFNLGYKVNGGSPSSNAVSTTLNSCDTASFVLSSVTFSNGVNSLKVYTDSPNGNADADASNDSSSRTFCTPLSGTYTIGGSSPNFATFADAMTVLNCGGLAGPVTFNVRAGTYIEQFQINTLTGSSSTNTVTFQAENGTASSVVLQYNVASAYVVLLSDADNIILKTMTLRNTAGGPVIKLQTSNSSEKCDNVTVRGCILSSAWGVSQTNSVIYTTGNNTSLKIKGNSISNCYGIYIYGNTTTGAYTAGFELDSNTFNNASGAVFYALNLQYLSAPQITYNNIVKTGCCADWLGTIGYISGAMNLSNNYMSTSGGNGFRLYNINRNSETTYANIYNNCLINSYATSNYVVSIEGSRYVRFFYNSLYASSSGSCKGLDINGTAASMSQVHVLNNILATTGGYPLYLNNSNAITMISSSGSCNYNNYYQTSGSNLAYINGSTLTTVAGIQGSIYTSPSNNDLNSVSTNPSFTSSSNLHVGSSSAMIGIGALVTGFTFDYDNTNRIDPPTIGADEVGSVIRTNTSDYIVNSGCPTFSGSNWIHVRDASSNIVFSINPNGNNLGTTCWGVRIYSTSGLRTDSTSIYNSGVKKFGYYLDRNFYITPTNQPATPVTLRFYHKYYELSELVDSVVNKYNNTIGYSDIDITKFNGTSDLDPLNNTGTSANYVLLNSTAYSSGNDYFLEVSTPSFSEFMPSYTPESPNSPLSLFWNSIYGTPVQQDAKIDFSVLQERDIVSYSIERSFDGIYFNRIGNIEATHPSLSLASYLFMDKGAANLAQVVYYRVVAHEANGSEYMSPAVTVAFNGEKIRPVLYVFPNPAQNIINIQLPKDIIPENAQIQIHDLTGKLIYTSNHTVSSGMIIPVSLDAISKGTYIISIHNSQLNLKSRFTRN